ncbi:hypothetical protein MNBD_GAMMA24-1116 [hydrothermal vent metagenome]|uniref:DUF4124 domain-containing protein n=1 Tax=hydrothermal vent metagenome TaxID=652676 RepID=A0A3B1C3K9_9ZZZZ
MRRILFILFISLSLSLVAATKVYKKVNPDGSVAYSDVPFAEGGEVIKLKPLPTVSLPPLTPNAQPAPAAPAKPFQYESVRILFPADDEAIRSNNGNISFRGEIKPGLQSNLEHHIEWLLDGKPIPGASGLNPNLKNLDRGTHQLQLRVVNFDGKAVIQTPVISFHILRVRLGKQNIYAPTPVAP